VQDLLNDLLHNSSFGAWDVILAVVVLVVGWLTSTWARRGVAAALEKWSGLGPSGTNLVARLVRYAILLLTVGIVLTVLGAPLQPVLAAVIIVGVVAFLALRGIAANFGAGLVIQARRPVRIGDAIELDDVAGRIIEMTGRSVLLRTTDGKTIRVPNTMLLDRPLWNASESGAVRSDVRVRIRGAVDLDELCPTMLAAVAEAVDGQTPAPEALLHTVGPDRSDLTLRFWTRYDDREVSRSDVVRAVAARLAEAGVPGSVTSDPVLLVAVRTDETPGAT
jgi:small-conductance mechanosensitive channel